MKFRLIYLIGCLFLAGLCSAQSLPDLEIDVVYLASDYLEGRETGKEGEKKAASYIAKRFGEIGIQPVGGDQSWYQYFDFTFNPNPHAMGGEARKGKNVVGLLDNGAEYTIIIGAHYDHLGYGAFGSRHLGDPEIHNGADDNASGTAALIYLAEALKQSEFNSYNYLFLAFSGEELGLYGSKYYVNHPLLPLDKVSCMLNMDMIGRLNEEKTLVVNGTGTSPVWKEIIPKLEVDGIHPKMNDSGIGASDHTSFYLKDIPALHFFTGGHNDYHKPVDDASLVNFEGLKSVSDYILALIEQLQSKGKLAFTKTKQEGNQRTAAAFKVTLGVMPDYVFNGKGMRIDGVIDDRPASKAGLENGDIIIQMGDMEIKDIYDYMEGLSTFEKGQRTFITIKRGEDVMKKEVIF